MSLPALLLQVCLALYLHCARASESPWRKERIAVLNIDTFHELKTGNAFEHFAAGMFRTIGVRGKGLYAAKHGYDFHLLTFKPNVSLDGVGAQVQWNRAFWTRRMFGSRTKPGELAGPDDTVARCDKYDWIFWVDADVFITNLTIPVTDVIEAARRLRPNQDYPHFIASRNADLDTSFSFNTGTALVRCSDLGLRLMNKMVELRVTHKDDTYIKGWEHQAALMIAYRDLDWVREITTFVPPKLLNAYPYRLGDDNGNLRSCGEPQGAECQKGYWTPGDFLIHFPGSGKKFVSAFLHQNPPSTWPGANDDFTPGRRRRQLLRLRGV